LNNKKSTRNEQKGQKGQKNKKKKKKRQETPAEAVGIFSGVKILTMPSFGREVKQFVRVTDLRHVKRTLLDYVEV
jgi:5'(3')-deoxyribonucleotidase